MSRLVAVVLLVTYSFSLVGLASADAATVRSFELIGSSDLGARGMNAGLAIAGDCGYVGSRSGTQGTLILDLSDPSSPEVAGALPFDRGSTQREVRAVDDLNILIVLNYRLDAGTTSPNSLDLYDISDCAQPAFRSRYDFGGAMPHEFFLWRDPSSQRPGRLLAYVAMWGHWPNVRVIDVSDVDRPVELTAWDAVETTGILSRIHSVTVSPNGRRAYLADWSHGLMVLDTSALARNRGDLTPVLLTPPDRWLLPGGGNLHSAVYVPNAELVIATQEIYGPGTCPYGRVTVVNVSEPAAPTIAGSFGIDENDPAACAVTAQLDGAFTTHNPLVVGNLLFVTWYAGGLRAVDLSDPTQPREAGAFVPDPLPAVAADDLTLGTYPIRMWSSPIVRDGLIYVVDIRNGLFILRYTGIGASEIERVEVAEGNAT